MEGERLFRAYTRYLSDVSNGSQHHVMGKFGRTQFCHVLKPLSSFSWWKAGGQGPKLLKMPLGRSHSLAKSALVSFRDSNGPGATRCLGAPTRWAPLSSCSRNTSRPPPLWSPSTQPVHLWPLLSWAPLGSFFAGLSHWTLGLLLLEVHRQ